MTKYRLMALCLLLMTFVSSSAQAEGISWLTNYEEAIHQSKQQSKPLLLFFTGSDWCTWCNKLEEETFKTQDFADQAANHFIFLKLDFPVQKELSPAQIEQNRQLQEKFDIRSFPTVIILDADQQQIGITGYRPGGGKSYANYLNNMMHDYSAYQRTAKTIAQGNLSGNTLKSLLQKAQEYNLQKDQIAIIAAGMQSDQADYFMIERYRTLAHQGKIHDQEAVSLKEQLQHLDPTNQYLTHYQLACIEFDACANAMEKEHTSADLAVAPLINYIEKFGANDQENLWRIHMIISQVYASRNQQDKAIKFAQCAHDCVPETTTNTHTNTKQEIALAIETLKKNSGKD